MKTIVRLCFPVLLLLNTTCTSHELGTIIITEGGKVEGIVEDGITVFRGIPFAAPPVGDLRWKAPQPVKKWEGILKTDKFAPACPQMYMDPGETSEDCLYLNIWTPAKLTNEKLPVMVWIHGGGFALGSTSSPGYSGENLAKMGVIFVSIAYRIGPLGFMAHPELTAESENHVSGNYGLLDQIAGLNWVQRNIEAFGGDPAKVTIFGESAGAISVSMLCASPLTAGLFRGAISESGGSFAPVCEKSEKGDCIQLLSEAEKLGLEFMSRMGAGSLAELRNIPPEKWQDDPLSRMGGFWPVVDNYVITDDQYKLYQSGKYNDVNVIIGTNSDEGSMFLVGSNVPPEQYIQNVKSRFGPVAEKILEVYPVDPVTGTYRPLADLFRETAFAWPSWTWARLQTQTGKSKVFVYYFDQSDAESIFHNVPEGASHGSEIAYVFRHLEQNPSSKPTDEQKALSEIMSKYWTNFAKHGDPNGAGLPVWPVFKDGEETVMQMKGNPHTIPVQNMEQLKVIDEYFAWKRGSD
jgi:para-nitrobenzyl esterase